MTSKSENMVRQALINELKHEGAQTRKMLERIPFDKFNWKPHEKSKELGKLAIHVAEIPGWVSRSLSTSEFDMATMKRQTPELQSKEDLLKLLDDSIQNAVNDLENANDADMGVMWTFKRGDHVIFTLPRVAVIRSMALSHLVHHRGQLSVYLRLLDVPVPGMYGPSADEM
jgi:uncharacterized damage-inducible protein DinB